MLKRTPFYDLHIKYNAKMVEYAGYDLPIQYSGLGLVAEHHAVRQRAGLFDVSHMGEFILSGESAEDFSDYLLSGDIRGLNDGQIRYTLMPNDNGGAVDDVLIYKFNQNKYMLVVNASNIKKDEDWIRSKLFQNVKIENISDDVAQLALQGPSAKEIIKKLCNESDLPQKYYWFKDEVDFCGAKCLISRTGYTGEFGYEIYLCPQDAATVYEKIMEAGQEFGIAPCGLGCRDSLRFEAGMPLYGHELNDEYLITEAGLDFTVKLNKGNFIGRDFLLNNSPKYQKIGARVIKGIARENDKVFYNDEEAGVVTSGTHSPTLGYAVAALRVKNEFVDKPLCVQVRGRILELQHHDLPFYKR